MNAPERRRRADESGRVTCRVCFARIDLSLDRIDDTPMYVYHRCPACEQWFTIRREDLELLRAREAADGADDAAGESAGDAGTASGSDVEAAAG